MISSTFVSVRITPEIGRRIEARVLGEDGLEPLPFPVRFAGHGHDLGYRNALTNDRITVRIIDWRDYRFRGSQTAPQRPTVTPKLDAGLAAVIAAGEAPRRSWYARPRPIIDGQIGESIAEAMRAKIKASISRTRHS